MTSVSGCPRVIYSPRYNIGFYGLEKLHPFDSRKYGKAWKALRRHFGSRLNDFSIFPTREVSRDELLSVHTEEYLGKLRDSAYVAQAIEIAQLKHFPAWAIDWHVLRPMRWATRGTIVAAEHALSCGTAINLSGGYHHAKPGRGEGFSIYCDVAIAVKALRASMQINESDRVVYIDTDAHQGNGICHTFMEDNRVFIFDMFNSRIYPMFDVAARKRIDCEVPLTSATTDGQYMGLLRRHLPGFLDSVCKSNVGIAIYNAGTDPYRGDALGSLNVSAKTIRKRDLFVVEQLRKRNLATVMVLSGGYSKQSFRMVADSVIELIEREMHR